MKKYLNRLFIMFAMALFVFGGNVVYGASVSNGYYMIRSGNSSARFLDIENSSLNNGVNLHIYKNNGSTNQIFYIQKTNGYYTIRCLHSGKYLHKSGSGDDVVQWSGTGNNARWNIENAGNGYYYFINRVDGKYLDNTKGRTDLNNKVKLYTKTKKANQKWYLVKVNEPRFTSSVTMKNVPSGTLTNPGEVTFAGNVKLSFPATTIHLGIYNTSGKHITGINITPNNRTSFDFGKKINISKLEAGSYFFGMQFIDSYNRKIQSSKYPFNVRKYVAPTYARPSNNTYYLASALNNNYVVEVDKGWTFEGMNIQLWINKRGSNQRFKIEHVGDGWYKIIDTNSNKSLNVNNGESRSGVSVKLASWNGTYAQLWRFFDAGDGYYYIQNKLGYYLDVSGAKIGNGTDIQVYTQNKTNAQKWKLLTEQQETNRLSNLVGNASIRYTNEKNQLDKCGEKVVNNVVSAAESAIEPKKAAIRNSMQKMFDASLPAYIENAFMDALIDTAVNNMASEPSSYKDVKTPVELVKRVAEKTPYGNMTIPFTAGGVQYQAKVDYQWAFGACVYFITINNRYKGIGLYLNENDISQEMKYLNDFAQLKIDEAKKTFIKDATKLMAPKELQDFVKKTLRSAFFSELKKVSSYLEALLKEAENVANKGYALKEAFDGLNSLNLKNASAEKVASTITGYNKKIEDFDKAVSAFFTIR